MATGSAYAHTIGPKVGPASGSAYAYTMGLPIQTASGSAYAHTMGPPVETASGSAYSHTMGDLVPSEFAGPVRETVMSVIVPPPATEFAGPIVDSPLAVDLTLVGPTIHNPTVTQRDTAQTFLVDVAGELSDPSADDVNLSLEWARSASGPWSPATLQGLDRKHTSNPITGVPVSAPGTPFNLVWAAFFDLPEGSFADIHVRITAEDL